MLLLCQIEHTTQLAKAYMNHPLGHGFESQVPSKFHIIFSNAFLCRFPNGEHHKPHKSGRQVSQKTDPKAKGCSTPCSKSMSTHLIPEVNKGFVLLGQNCFTKPPLGIKPPWFSFYFFLLSFYFLFIIINYYYLINK